MSEHTKLLLKRFYVYGAVMILSQNSPHKSAQGTHTYIEAYAEGIFAERILVAEVT